MQDNQTLTILFFGDVCGGAGMRALRFSLSKIRQDYHADMVIVNGENSADGYGIDDKTFADLKASGVDVVTLGNHGLEREEIIKTLETTSTLLRPENFQTGTPGVGYGIYDVGSVKVGVGNIHTHSGIMGAVDSPFKAIDRIIKNVSKVTPIIFIDVHGENTDEKEALFMYSRGKVSAICGTHTHVQTMDEKILDGTGYITDVGMCGAKHSVIGGDIELSIRKSRECLPIKITPSDTDAVMMGVKVEIDKITGKCVSIERLTISE